MTIVHADVNYIRNPPAVPGEVLEFVTEAEEHSTMQTRPGARFESPTRGRSTRTSTARVSCSCGT